jgi:hypothetical protein
MLQDLIAARWQTTMAEDPSQHPDTVLAECTQYWQDPSQKTRICALVQHQGSFKTLDAQKLKYEFQMPLRKALEFCKNNKSDPCCQIKTR